VQAHATMRRPRPVPHQDNPGGCKASAWRRYPGGVLMQLGALVEKHPLTRQPQPLKPNTTSDGQLACAFGEPWMGPHYICQAATAAICGVPISEVSLPDYSHLLPKQLTSGEPVSSDWLF
jgi:hypothetical protein